MGHSTYRFFRPLFWPFAVSLLRSRHFLRFLDIRQARNGTCCRGGFQRSYCCAWKGYDRAVIVSSCRARRRLFHQIKPPAGARGFSPDRYIITSAVQAVLASVPAAGSADRASAGDDGFRCAMFMLQRCRRRSDSNNCDGLGETGGRI